MVKSGLSRRSDTSTSSRQKTASCAPWALRALPLYSKIASSIDIWIWSVAPSRSKRIDFRSMRLHAAVLRPISRIGGGRDGKASRQERYRLLRRRKIRNFAERSRSIRHRNLHPGLAMRRSRGEHRRRANRNGPQKHQTRAGRTLRFGKWLPLWKGANAYPAFGPTRNARRPWNILMIIIANWRSLRPTRLHLASAENASGRRPLPTAGGRLCSVRRRAAKADGENSC